jgi:hypothetical protein
MCISKSKAFDKSIIIVSMEIRKRKFRCIDHTLRKDDEQTSQSCFSGILKETEEEGDQETAGGDPL